MPPQPTGRYGLLRIPAPGANRVDIRFSLLTNRDVFDPTRWASLALAASPLYPGWWEFDLDAQRLPDGDYEYEFILNGATNTPIPDPYADRLTRFGGYRGIFTITLGARATRAFRWDPAVEAGNALAQNNAIVIYEMPLKWMTSALDNSLVDLGTFEEVVFEHLDQLQSLNVNCIEVLPIQDTSQTLDWGYGTRFYFAPDFDMGSSVDARFFIKSCHARGIRVVLDIVMAFSSDKCPLQTLASAWFSSPPNENGRNGWGQILFRYNTPSYDDYFAAREYLCQMGEFWVTEYHVDGFRIDAFPDIANWEFVQQFRDRATAANTTAFPGKPFLVVAENTNRQFITTQPDAGNPNGRKVVDAIWNFGFQADLRALVLGNLTTTWGQPSLTERVRHLLSKDGTWNGLTQGFDLGYADMACAVGFATSHDVQNAPRMMNEILGSLVPQWGLGDGGRDNVRQVVDVQAMPGTAAPPVVQVALARVFGVFALIATSVSMPMWLAGEEFADIHDTDYNDTNAKQQDPVQWTRAAYPAHAALLARVRQLLELRTAHRALQRNEILFFYFHPNFDDNSGPRVFGYTRSAGLGVGSPGQVIVIANMGGHFFPDYALPNWPWAAQPLTEAGAAAPPPTYDAAANTLHLKLDAFAARVFSV
jgi:Alpha amylase, catalytic domain